MRLEFYEEFEFRGALGLGAGLRWQTVWQFGKLEAGCPATSEDWESFSPEYPVQTGLEPYLVLEPPSSAFFLRVGTLVGMDGCLSVSAGERSLVTTRSTVGVSF